MIRSREAAVTFRRPFVLTAVDRELPAGTYRLSIDEECIEELSFPVYRRITTMIHFGNRSTIEMWTIDHNELEKALERDGGHNQIVYQRT